MLHAILWLAFIVVAVFLNAVFGLSFSETVGWALAFGFLLKYLEYKEKYESQLLKTRIAKNTAG